MAKTKISEFNANPALNTDIDSINIAEGCAPSGINDAIRELMSQLKDWQSGTSNDPMVIGSTGSLTLNQGTANGVAYLNGSKVVTSGSALTFDGTNFATTGFINTAAGYTVGGLKIGGNLAVASQSTNLWIGDILNNFTSGVAFYATGSEQMRLTSTGLGIGTSSPAYKLDVVGNSAIARLQSTGASQNAQLNFQTTVATWSVGQNITLSTGALEFYNGSLRATLDSSGNLGLGVTPSAWTTVTPVFQINRAALYGYGNEVSLSANYLFSSGDKYIASDFATRYNQANGQHRFYTAPSGTAGNAITFTQAMTLTAGGNLFVGSTTAPTGFARVSLVGGEPSGTGANSGVQFTYNSSTYGGGAITTVNAAGGGMSFYTFTGNVGSESYTERARIDSSGRLNVGATSFGFASRAGFRGDSTSVPTVEIQNESATGTMLTFRTNGEAQVGSITFTNTAVAYNTSSDYRLKNSVAPMTGALAKVALLKPVTYKWNADGSDGEGFIAHELAEVCPHAVTGEKDAVDEEGNPKYQGIDTSFLVATLTAAIQELNAKFEAYKASHP